MARILNLGVGQLGPIARNDSRRMVVDRMIDLLKQAHSHGVELVVFPELALTTFFPRWLIEDEAELDFWYEKEMPSADTQPLFDAAKKLGVGFCLGYAELAFEEGRKRRFNTSIIVDGQGDIVGKYRKIHLPGHDEPQPGRHTQHLEKRYFEAGNYGFPVWDAFKGRVGMCICNDRRWPETYRVMALQGAELILLGYNSPTDHSGYHDIDRLTEFHNHLAMQAGAYQNSVWVAGAAHAGEEEGSDLIGGSAIVAPSGEIVVTASTREDELIWAACDLDMVLPYRETYFDFKRHREPRYYRLISDRKGVGDPVGPDYYNS